MAVAVLMSVIAVKPNNQEETKWSVLESNDMISLIVLLCLLSKEQKKNVTNTQLNNRVQDNKENNTDSEKDM